MNIINNLKKFKCLNSTTLKIIAMTAMFLDHAGKTLFFNQEWMVWVGRIAFPIFAFQIAEGYNHTKDFKEYLKRMFIYALISEIPYNLLYGFPIYPLSQNVLFTFCISLVIIRLIDKSWQKHWALGLVTTVISVYIGYWLAAALLTDYKGFGVLMVVSFWLFGRVKFGWILQLLAIIYINWEMIGGFNFTFMINGREIWVPVQAFAILAMIPIFMYNGEKGPGGKRFRRAVYIFYPLHMFVLGSLMIVLSLLMLI